MSDETETAPPSTPCCAQHDCTAAPRYVLRLRLLSGPGYRNEISDDKLEDIAYACDLPHFGIVMRATRHLGARRRIEMVST